MGGDQPERAPTEGGDPEAFEAVWSACGRDLPCLLVDRDGVVRAVRGDAAAWFPDGCGQPLASLVAPAEEVRRCVERNMVGADELRLSLPDGRRLLMAPRPCRRGWAVVLVDTTATDVLGEALAHRERLQSVGGLSSAIARELNDPISIVQGRLELLLELGVVQSEAVERHLLVALEHARRISATLRNLRLVGRRASARLHRVRLSDVTLDALDLIGPRGARVQADIDPPDLAVGGDQALFARVLANTLRQTIEGTARGPVHLTARRRGPSVRVQVHCGRVGRSEPSDWPELQIETTLLRSIGGGLQGRLVQGAPTFELSLPLPPATRSRARQVRHQMLVLGDLSFHDDICSLLDKDGFAFDHACSPEALLEPGFVAPDVVVCDLVLPGGVSGLGVARQLAELHAHLIGRVVVVLDAPLEAPPPEIITVAKPLTRARLLDALGRRVRRG